ncbi:ARM repeat-containing protein [Mycena floridula]|nr:ARM repeat-containing protein [Mycena floridula]
MHAPESFLNAAVNVDQLRPPDRQSESSPPRSRQPSATGPASIWAPQPQSSEMSLSGWPRTLDSFCKVAEKESSRQTTTDDVFGPAPAAPRVTMDIGAIGDGRKINNGEYDSTHVEQLLRTLNLNSPDPYIPVKKPSLNLSFESTSTSTGGSGSPDCSPASISSALLTPTDLSPTRSFHLKQQLPYEYSSSARNSTEYLSQTSLLFESGRPIHESYGPHSHSLSHSPPYVAQVSSVPPYLPALNSNGYQLPSYKPISEHNSPLDYNFPLPPSSQQSINVHHRRPEPAPMPSASSLDWLIPQSQGLQQQQHQMHAPQLRVPLELQQDNQPQRLPTPAEWLRSEGYALGPQPAVHVYSNGAVAPEDNHGPVNQRSSSAFPTFHQQQSSSPQAHSGNNEPINFLSLLHPSSSPPYHTFVSRIIKSSDQQASIFLQQKLKVADLGERTKIVDAICARGFDMMAHRFGNWAVQRCLEAAATPEERRKIVSCMRGRIVELATNCYGCHVLQKALDCEEDIRLLIVSELLHGDPAQTLVNKHASHVWSKIMELSWTPPAPPIFAYVNRSLQGKWAALACHETGSLVVQHAFENLEDSAKDGIIDELLNQGPAVFSEVAKNQWGSYCIQHILEHGSDNHRQLTLDHLLSGLLEYATNEQGSKSVNKAMKEGGKDVLDRMVKKMCEPAKGARRAMIVDLALSVTGSQLIASVLPTADKDQRALLYDCIKGHIVTLRGCKTGSKVIWLFDRMRAYYGY